MSAFRAFCRVLLVEDATLTGVERVFDWFDLDDHG